MSGTDPIIEQRRTARQLSRLFKLERIGALDRRGVEVRQRVIERRAALLGALLRLDAGRCASASPRSPSLEQTLVQLAQEVGLSLRTAQGRVERLGGDLRLRLGEGPATGIRDNSDSRLLGKS